MWYENICECTCVFCTQLVGEKEDQTCLKVVPARRETQRLPAKDAINIQSCERKVNKGQKKNKILTSR